MKSKTAQGAKADYAATKQQVAKRFNQAKAKLAKLQQRTENYISENPKRAAAIALGVGAVVGAALTAYWMQERKRVRESKDTEREKSDA